MFIDRELEFPVPKDSGNENRWPREVQYTISEEYRRQNHIGVKIFPTVAVAMNAVSRQEVDALVFSETTLKYTVNHENQDAIEILPEILEPQYYAFTLTEGSPLRELVNQAILNITAQPLWHDIQYYYMGSKQLVVMSILAFGFLFIFLLTFK